MIKLTKEQRKALFRVHARIQHNGVFQPYRAFRKLVLPGSFGCVMVPFCNMWLGIEKDGHTHS